MQIQHEGTAAASLAIAAMAGIGLHSAGVSKDIAHLAAGTPTFMGARAEHHAVPPTVSPSILVRYGGPDAGVGGAPPQCCHFFVRAGNIEYLSDCTHAFAGKIIPMEPW